MTFEENTQMLNIYRGILCSNPAFQAGKEVQVEYRLHCPEYAQLRSRYELEKRAGRGSDLQRAVRLMKYLAPRLSHSSWYDNHVPCNGLDLLAYSLDKPEQGINCLNKAKILEECCLAVGIYARRMRMLPYSPYDMDCHVVTEIYDRAEGRWCMLDPTTNGFLVDEQDRVLSLLEARARMAGAEFVTFRTAGCRTRDLEAVRRRNIGLNTYYAKNLFWLQADAVSQFGETGRWLNFVPLHFSVHQNQVDNWKYRIAAFPEMARQQGIDPAPLLERYRRRLAQVQAEPEAEPTAQAVLLAPPVEG